MAVPVSCCAHTIVLVVFPFLDTNNAVTLTKFRFTLLYKTVCSDTMTNIPYEALGPELHSDPEVAVAFHSAIVCVDRLPTGPLPEGLVFYDWLPCRNAANCFSYRSCSICWA